MHALDHYATDDLKLTYRVLHGQILGTPELMDSTLLEDLQKRLQLLAERDDVDIKNHAAWDAWLGVAEVPCADRVKERVAIQLAVSGRA